MKKELHKIEAKKEFLNIKNKYLLNKELYNDREFIFDIRRYIDIKENKY